MYNVMAAGKPIIAVADDDSELGILVQEEKIGWVVPPNDATALLATIRNAQAKSKELNEMGRRARAVALKYSLERVLRSYQELLESLVNDGLASRQTDVGQMDHV
jgi:glycosyltransferase involved in cell wall biosynthesis